MTILEASSIAEDFVSDFPNYDSNAEFVGELDGGMVFYFKSKVHGHHIGLPFYCLVISTGEAFRLEPPLVFRAMRMHRH